MQASHPTLVPVRTRTGSPSSSSAGADTLPRGPKPHRRSAWSVPEAGPVGVLAPGRSPGPVGPQLGVWPRLDALLLPVLEPQALGSAPPAAADTRPLCPDCFCSHHLCSISQISPPKPWEAFGFLLSSRLAGTSFDHTVENEVCSDSFGAFLLCWHFCARRGV